MENNLTREQILESWAKTDFGSEELNLIRDKNINYIKDLDIDYICVENATCCEKCAPFRNRYYNLSGNDKRFPKLPTFFMSADNINHCRLSYYPVDAVIIDTFIETQSRGDIVAISNRPYIDDRTTYEIDEYEKYISKHK